MRISDWSSDVCSSDLAVTPLGHDGQVLAFLVGPHAQAKEAQAKFLPNLAHLLQMPSGFRAGLMQVVERGARQFKLARRLQADGAVLAGKRDDLPAFRSEEHTSELQSLMRISYAVLCLKKKKT